MIWTSKLVFVICEAFQLMRAWPEPMWKRKLRFKVSRWTNALAYLFVESVTKRKSSFITLTPVNYGATTLSRLTFGITYHNGTQHNNKWNATLSIIALSIIALSIIALSIIALSIITVLLCWASFMLSATKKPFMLSVVMLNVVVLSVFGPFIIAISSLMSHFLFSSKMHFAKKSSSACCSHLPLC
jgi:hypothetical protein